MTVSTDSVKTGVYAPRSTSGVLLVGDSITANNVTSNAATNYYQNIGAFNWANALMDSRLYVVANAGVAGRWITGGSGMAGAIDTLLSQNACGYVALLAGTNDIANNVSYADITAGFTSIFDACQRRGVYVLASTILPRAIAGLTTAQHRRLYAVNSWLRDQGQRRLGLCVADPFRDLADPTNANGDPLAVDFYDTPALHPGPAGAMKVGTAWARDWVSVIPRARPISPSAGDIYDATDNPRGCLTDGSFMQSLSATSGTGFTGNNPASWTIQRITGAGTLTGSAVARTDYPGNWWRAAITTETNAAAQYQIRQNTFGTQGGGTRYTVGDQVYAEGEIKVTHTGTANYVFGVVLSVTEYDRDGNQVFIAKALSNYSGSNNLQNAKDYTASIRTPIFTTIGSTGVGAASQRLTTAVDIIFNGSVSGALTVDFGQVCLRKYV